jgi:hypothetical protein
MALGGIYQGYGEHLGPLFPKGIQTYLEVLS